MQKTYDGIVEGAKRKNGEDLVDGWKKMETQFWVESLRFAVSAGDELLRMSSDVQIFLRKTSAFFSIRVTKALDVGCSSVKSLSASVVKVKNRVKRRVRNAPRRLPKAHAMVTIILMSTRFKRRYDR